MSQSDSARKLLITHNIADLHLEEVKSIVPDWDVIAGKESDVWLPHIQDAEVIAGWKKEMNDPVRNGSSNLRWLQTWSAGINGLPLAELEEGSVTTTSANGVHANPISETILALMLGLTRNIHTYVRQQQTKTWHHANNGLEMHGKTAAVVGAGSIGRETARLLKAFGMRTLGVRRSGEPCEWIDEMTTPDRLDELLPRCDYVIATLPLTDDTSQMFGKKQFNLMKETAFFINIGRGGLVVEEELIQALEAGTIAGAGLDVFEKEPLGDDSPLWEMKQVIVTPHTSGSTVYYNERVMEDIFIPNLKAYVAGKSLPVNELEYGKGY
ncbi:D-2-hydroxyacid dehydrogenase [Alteribacter natronophilus]|uniref:D-2-hydroxyacid dehydrogenase n=1 Tax=Alteribacter natronophilus TaxID=2583810 RepID=UPI00110EF4D1|nr:D-2-hydroxyacid dehydrogenase [Alteribacter natronophilus]TMW71012.1 D-2-hydroxyacid dehydrogenase [Alteribacter natronophilus]